MAILVSVPDPKPTLAQIAFVILEAIYAPDEVWGRDYGIPDGAKHNCILHIAVFTTIT